MKVHRVVLLVVDHDNIGRDEVSGILENIKYPNHCMNPQVVLIETADIGEWSDDHPLNTTNPVELARQTRAIFPD